MRRSISLGVMYQLSPRFSSLISLAGRHGRGELEPTESPSTAANVTRAGAAFGYQPQVSLEEGLAR